MRKSNEQIIREYSNVVYQLAFAMLRNKSDADDVYQEVFLRYVKRQPVFLSGEHEKAWFLKVTSNCAKSLASSPFRKRTKMLTDNQEAYCMDEQSLDLNRRLSRLPVKYRTVIHLYYFEDLPTDRIGMMLNVNQATVRSQLSRARAMLKETFTGDNDGI